MSINPAISYDPGLEPGKVRAALIWGFRLPECSKTASTPEFLSKLLNHVRDTGEGFISPARRTVVRNMLRFGHFKPSGRSKPSSEYLLTAALAGEFPLVNGPVDVNNAVSLEWGYPASIFDLDLCGAELLLRRGMEGESYIFNTSGQIIDLKDLLCVYRSEAGVWKPCGNPVKDSMATKTNESTHNVVAVIYAPITESSEYLEEAAGTFASLLMSECGAAESGWETKEPGARSQEPE
jgi:DNA/RNA-binding domain of Phe-tRNA-synthetase-like protein